MVSVHPYDFRLKVDSPTYQHAAASYDPKLGWSKERITQPERMRVESYLEIAKSAMTAGYDHVKSFLKKHKFSHIALDLEEFQKYENNYQIFSDWADEQCKKQNKKRPDILVIKPCAKGLERSLQKTNGGFTSIDPADNIDYLRMTYVCLNNDEKSLERYAKLMRFLEADPKTIARKNYNWKPHPATGCRYHKTLKTITTAQNSDFPSFKINMEIKASYEDQMDIDKLTRVFLKLQRGSQERVKKFNVISASNPRRHNIYSQLAEVVEKEANDIRYWGKLLYDRVNHDAGLNRFLAPDIRDTMTPFTYREILSRILEQPDFDKLKKAKILDLIIASQLVDDRDLKKLDLALN